MAHAIALKTIDLDWIDLEIAYRDSASGARSVLDTRRGEVMAVWDERELRYLMERDPDRYLRVPTFTSREALEILRDFVATQQTGPLARRLRRAVQGRGGLTRGLDLLVEDALLYDAYSRFEELAVFERLMWWLAACGVRATFPPPSSPTLHLVSGPASAA